MSLNSESENCKINGCKGKCCQLQPIYITEINIDRLKNSKNKMEKTHGGWFMTWDGKWCGFFKEESKTCSLGDFRPDVCKEWWCNNSFHEKLKD